MKGLLFSVGIVLLLVGGIAAISKQDTISPEDRDIAAVMDTKEFKEIARNLALAKLNKQRADEDVKNLEKHDALAKISMDRFQYLSKNFIWGENY